MQRWKQARRGPKRTLVLGLLLGVASVFLFQAAYGAEPPYPGPPGLPGIPNGPTLGCNNSGTDASTWVCGFNAESTITFKVNGHFAGTAPADSNGCVLVVVAFSHGTVSVDGGPEIAVKPGLNHLVVEGHKTTGGVSQVVGLSLPFQTPPKGSSVCIVAPPPTVPPTSGPTQPTSGQTSIPGRPTTTPFPVETTPHGFYPTTLAKALETPLIISPNRVILEASLLAAVLAAVLAAGALGAMWTSGDEAAMTEVADEGGGAPTTPEAPPTPGPAGGAGAGAAAATSSAAEPTRPMQSAFERPYPGPPQGGG